MQDWMKEHRDGLSPLEAEFMKASQNVKKRERMSWFAIAGVGVMLLAVIIFAMTGQLDPLIYRPIDMPDGYWIPIPEGDFEMGSENGGSDEMPVHTVYVDKFEIGKYEVTNRQYAQCIKAGICVGSAFEEGKDLRPVVNVTWNDAKNYCEWVGGRLPTEAQWEKAASWNDEKKIKLVYPWGNDIDCSYANYGGCGVNGITEVGSYESGKSPYGVYDMGGNVWEWVNDWYQSDYYATLGDNVSNPQGPSIGNSRVLRGGSWYNLDIYVRSASRYRYLPADTSNGIGFRCARSP
jgi:formylglycine-generating enzyme required for sulfatase activity